nr:hypothetical protein [Tanacetum cinerariifolium]
MPPLVTHDSPDLLESSSRFQRVLEMTIDIRDTTEPIATIGVAPQSTSTSGCTESVTRRRKWEEPDNLSESHMVQQCNKRSVRLRAETDCPI